MYGCYIEHLREVLEHKDHPNLLILHYEDMKINPTHEINKLNDFLSTNLTQLQIENVSNILQSKFTRCLNLFNIVSTFSTFLMKIFPK